MIAIPITDSTEPFVARLADGHSPIHENRGLIINRNEPILSLLCLYHFKMAFKPQIEAGWFFIHVIPCLHCPFYLVMLKHNWAREMGSELIMRPEP